MNRPRGARDSTELANLNREAPPQLPPQNISPFKPRPSPDDADPASNWAKGPLATFDVFALIVNKMIGTGIYSAPATVYVLTGNKSLTLGLFSIGFIYTLISMVMYLDYAEALPYTGGELVYVDEISAHAIAYLDDESPEPRRNIQRSSTQHVRTQGPPNGGDNGNQRVASATTDNAQSPSGPRTLRKRLKRWLHKFLGDGLLAYISYSFSFIGLFNSGTNSMQTGRMILICIASTNEAVNPDVHRDVVRLIGVCTMTALCLLQYFSPAFGRKLNQGLAVVKIIFLVALCIVAIVATARPLTRPDGTVVNRAADWHEWHKPNSWKPFAKALLAVLFSFEGWENATFVAGEIPTNRPQVLRRGFITAVFTVGLLYLLIVALFLHSITWQDISGASQNVNYAPMLSGNGVMARRCWAILGAISSLGSLNSIIYTFSRVKQAIGQAEVLPWSNVWKKDDALQRDRASDHPGHFLDKAPQGGLIIHWTMSAVVIAGSSSIPSTLESVSLPGYVQTYAHCFILMIIGAAYLNLSSREDALTPPLRPSIRRPTQKKPRKPPFRPSKMKSSVGQWAMAALVVVYVALNLAILIINAIPPYEGSDGSKIAFKGFGFPTVALSILLFGITYYILVFGTARRVYPQSGPPGSPEVPPVIEEGLLAEGSWLNLLRFANVRCEIRKDRYFDTERDRVRRFGRRWRIVYSLPGDDDPAPAESGNLNNANDGVNTKKKGGPAPSRIADERFASFESDPRYRLPSKKQAKTTIDKRFSRMLKDEDFTATAKVDRYGRKVKSDSKKKALQRLYREEGEEDEDEEEGGEGIEVDDDDVVQRELLAAHAKLDPARGGGFSSSESESDSDDDEEEAGVDTETKGDMQRFQDEQADAEAGEVTNRIAIVNLDWDHVKSADLMALFSSFVPTSGGKIDKISVFPSEFGKERMQQEEVEGPPKALFKDVARTEESDDDSDEDSDEDSEAEDDKIKNELIQEGDDQDFDSDALRSYQLDRLRYFYAVMVCSSPAVAQNIYEATDGREYQSSSNFLDLRFVPDDVTFDDEARDECEKIPDSYKPVEFVTNALQSSKVKLTWDMHPDEVSRKESINRAFTGSRAQIEENDLRAYLASDSEDEISDGGAPEAEEVDEDAPKLSKKELARQKMRAALGLGDEPAVKSKGGPVGDMQITFTPALTEGAAPKKKTEEEETTLEKYVRKEKERKESKRQMARAKREGKTSDDEEVEEVEEATEAAEGDDLGASVRKEERRKKREAREAAEAESTAEKAQLAKVMADDAGENQAEHLEHFDMNEILRAEKRKAKKGKAKKRAEAKEAKETRGGLQEDFSMDVDDDRFKAVFDSHEYAIDPSNPKFKGSEGMKKLLEEGRKKRRAGEEEAEAPRTKKAKKGRK
ncbi:hypothetical protein G7Z17_g1479 [Cylindrodendrum hubeiense]|uniref:NUC153 domain-containing protein n=1 Tax=Cylindrodendrum hubeiense TaxID=595255 RepID=A0A9P5HMU5_9HYPO|nr:hypothetical protein G7Z17_g1479 [Cylindrodendrum hubeiense]